MKMHGYRLEGKKKFHIRNHEMSHICLCTMLFLIYLAHKYSRITRLYKMFLYQSQQRIIIIITIIIGTN